MNQINKIEPDDIKRLTAEQLVRLLDLLLHGEARDRLIAKHGIFVPFQINVPDGGRDGKWEAPIENCEYIPRELTYYQCKAESVSDSDCRDEVLRSDKTGDIRLKEKVKEVLERNGAYVFFSSHPCVGIDNRIKAVRKALADAGRLEPEKDCIEFLDANRIAAWVNMHASAFSYVCQHTTNFQPVGLRTLASWGEDSIFRYEFQSNEFLIKQIQNLREWLAKPRQVARISGPSGLGKTRLGYEVFSLTGLGNEAGRKALAASVAYTDIQFSQESVFGWIDQLCIYGLSGIVVVDNCPREWHQRLISVVTRQSSNLSLLTLDYEPEQLRTEFLHVLLAPERLRDVVPKILKSVPDLQHLEESEINRIADFAQGFPQIAILTAQAGRALDYRSLNYQGHLADRLLWGRGSPDSGAREIIRCLSVFSSVGVAGARATQLKFVLDHFCGGVTEYDFNRQMKRFREMRILQSAGDYIMVTPSPLAVALAAEWLDDAPDDYLMRLLPGIDANGLTKALCNQLSMLDFSEKAAALSSRLMGPNGPLSSAEVLNSKVGSQIFRALSEVNPLAATECLHRILSPFSPDQSREITIGRRDLVWALEKLCWSVETFSMAAETLLRFAAGENEKWSNNATGHFKQLFHLYLSGTQMPALERLGVLKHGLDSCFLEMRRTCVEALGAGLEHNQFMRSSGPETRGTRLPERDWEPRTYAEIWGYWREIFFLLRDQIVKSDQISPLAVETLGRGLGGVLTTPLAAELEEEFREIAKSQSGFWPSARDTIAHTLEYHEELPEDLRLIAERWLNYVQPKDLEHRLADIVSTPGWHHEKNAEGHYDDLSAKHAAELADELVTVEWSQFIPNLLQGEQQQAWAFGARYAETASHPRQLIERCLEHLRTIPQQDRNPQLVRGMISTIRDRSELSDILDAVASDPHLREVLVPLTTAAASTFEDFNRVAKLVERELLPPESLRFFAFGSVSNRFEDDKFHARLAELVDKVPQARPAIMEIVAMHCYSNDAKWISYRDLLERLVIAPEVVSMGRDLHFWNDNTKQLLLSNPSGDWVRLLTEAIIDESTRERSNLYLRDTLAEIAGLLLANYPKISWPVFEKALTDSEKRFRLIDLLGRGGSRFDDSGSPLWNLPDEEFKLWAKANKELIPLVLHFMSLYTVDKSENGTERFRWHPHVLALLEIGERDSIEGCLSANLLSFGSTGSRVPYLEKRIALVKDLITTENEELRAIAVALVSVLEAHKAHEEKRDAEHAAGIY